MDKFKIDTNIPSPPPRGSHNKKYPLREMEVGHSFACDALEYIQLVSAASWYGKRNGRKYSVRKEGDHYRCWRIA